MPADNWTTCPRCIKRAQRKQSDAIEAAAGMYGKVPQEDYLKAMTEATSGTVDPSEYQTFREDYEISGASYGAVEVSYSGGCRVCGLRLTFQHSHDIPGADN